ncbi:MAG TPA: glycine oxidase ThiO [Dehalococcoidia bacterium]|nr:glycine oxidase ThiO [Dehalococcoidia bacterium]
MKVIVVGGGVIGCSIALHLQKARASVVLLERGEIAGEASSAAAGMLIAPIEDTGNRQFDDLRRASLAMYPTLIREAQRLSGVDVEYKRQGMIRTARSEEFARKLKSLARRREGLEWIDGAALRKLEPALDPELVGAAYCKDDADLNPGLLTKALGGAAAKLGADVRTNTMLTGFLGRGSRVDGVSTSNGDVLADVVVLAAGPWTEPLSQRLGKRVSTPPMRGQMLAYRSSSLRHAVWGEDGYLVPKPRGLVFAGATIEDVGFRKTTTAHGLAGLKRMAGALVPALRKARVARSWAGLRPGSADGLPVIGRFPVKDNIYLATGHFRNGVLLAPITGSLVSEMVLRGRADRRLRAYSPERFG